MFDQKAYIESAFKKDSGGHILFLSGRQWYIVDNEQDKNKLQSLLTKEFKLFGTLGLIAVLSLIASFGSSIIYRIFNTKGGDYSITVFSTAAFLLAIIILLGASIFFSFKNHTLFRKFKFIKTGLPKGKLSVFSSISNNLTFRGLILCLVLLVMAFIFNGIENSLSIGNIVWGTLLFIAISSLIIIKKINKQKI